MDYFFIDDKRNIRKTYDDLINDINEFKRINKYIYSKDVYMIFVKILASLVVGESIEMLDMDLSKNELSNIGVDFNDSSLNNHYVHNIDIKDFQDLLRIIKQKEESWQINLYTSGTTGRPKKVAHSLSSLARNVKTSNKFSDNIWAFCYNPTHIAGLQVFWQAFYNKNTIIYTFDYTQSELYKGLANNKVTNISATPTFYRTNLLNPNFELPLVRYVTLGGERFDSDLANKLKNIFPNAKIRNIYASTEAGSIFSSDSDYFTIKKQFKDYIKIADNGELLINEKLLGKSESLLTNNGWYHTGDIVELVEEEKFKIVSRNTEMINIGGYKVNPNEIEEEIKKVRGVMDVLVFSRTNKLMGNVLVAELVKTPELDENKLEMQILKELNRDLQKWKIPRIFKFVDEIDKTRTGKKVRI